MAVAVDLFAGAGGFSLGAERAGYDVTHAIEVDSWACETLSHNHQQTRVVKANISDLDNSWVKREMPKYPDLLIGGPPCQGFSHAAVGRQDPKDPRNSLFQDFVRIAGVTEPQRLIIENVPGLLKTKTATGEPVKEVIINELLKLGYNVSVMVLNAHEFGVPQIRRRVFFVADAERQPKNQLAAKYGEGDLFQKLLPYLTVRDAISDLPVVDVGDLQDPVSYEVDPVNSYQRAARGHCQSVANHVPMRHTPRMIERFKTIRPGQSQSHVAAEHAPRLRVRKESQGTARYDQNNRRMYWDRPCHTVPATFYANFIHPELNRNFTPREGARIQSFPDDYVFKGKPTVVSQKLLAKEGREGERYLSQYVQIGNAVPPVLAEEVIRSLKTSLVDTSVTNQIKESTVYVQR